METWGPAHYGDPCRECGFDWQLSTPDAVAYLSGLPALVTSRLVGRDPAARHPQLGWSVTGYVCHIGDNLRIWAERLAGAAAGSGVTVGGYDENALAAARNYDSIHIGAALWSLQRAVGDWLAAVELAEARDVVLVHERRGRQQLPDVIRGNTHDAHHHVWDIQRTLDGH